jgi:hypothetical protein
LERVRTMKSRTAFEDREAHLRQLITEQSRVMVVEARRKRGAIDRHIGYGGSWSVRLRLSPRGDPSYLRCYYLRLILSGIYE